MKQAIGDSREVGVCGVPHVMTIVDGGVLFSNKSGFSGYAARYMFAYRSSLWYLEEFGVVFGEVPLSHFARMHSLLAEYIGPDHTEADGTVFELTFKK